MRLSYSLFVVALASSSTTTTNAFFLSSPQRTITPYQSSSSIIAPSSSTRLNYYSNFTNSNDSGGNSYSSSSPSPRDKLSLFDGYLTKVEAAFEKAQTRLDNMRSDIKAKESKSQRAVLAVEERMKNQQAQLSSKLEYTNEVLNVRVHQHDVVSRHTVRQEQLQQEMRLLYSQLEYEKDKMALSTQELRDTVHKKQSLQAQLQQLSQRLETSTQEWKTKYQAERSSREEEVEEAQRVVDETQRRADATAREADERIQRLTQALVEKEQEKQAALLSIRQEMKAQETELQQEVSKMTLEVSTVQQEAQQEHAALKDEFATSQQALEGELVQLRQLLHDQQAKMTANQQDATRLVAERTLLDTELTQLRDAYHAESAGWTERFAAEQETRQEQVAAAQAKVVQQEKEARRDAAEFGVQLTQLQEAVTQKEEEKRAAVRAIQGEME